MGVRFDPSGDLDVFVKGITCNFRSDVGVVIEGMM